MTDTGPDDHDNDRSRDTNTPRRSGTGKDRSGRPRWVRAAAHAGYLAGCLTVTVYATANFGLGGST